MHLILISSLPEVHGLFGLRHHYPIGGWSPAGRNLTPAAGSASPGEIGSMNVVDLARPGSLTETLRTLSDTGPIVAHLSGTSTSMLWAADELRAGVIPYVCSPMIPSIPSLTDRLSGMFSGVRSAPVADFELAAGIASGASAVIVDSEEAGRSLRRRAGLTGIPMLTVPWPELRMPLRTGADRTGAERSGDRESPKGDGFGNLALAFCDEVAPEWNVLRFIFAMEKINADGIVVAAMIDTDYARECADRAALNDRVRFLAFERGGAGTISDEVSAVLEKASIVVDPSPRGLGGAIARGFAAAGTPVVISRRSAFGTPSGNGIFTFEPSSWELLNHSITCAFNRAAGAAPPAELVAAPRGVRDAEIARLLTQAYGSAAGA